jgi:methylmalonyl-CoA mutase N-terminal domain/subunit
MTTDDFYRTRSGFPLPVVFDSSSLDERGIADLARWLGRPGKPPFTRGITPEGYRTQPWIMGQYAGYGSAEEANERYRLLLEQGGTGFSIALDIPTQMGLDSDDPLAAGEVGRVGVAIDTLADLEDLLDGLPLERLRSIRTTANAIGTIWLAMVIAFAEKNGFEPNGIRIQIQNDVLKEYVARGTFIFPVRPALELVADAIEYCATELPNWIPLTMSGYHIRETGATAVEELAFTFANGIAYCDAVTRRGVGIDEFAPKLFTFLTTGMDFLEEIAKFRAARRVWSEIALERFGAKEPASGALRIFAFSAGSDLVAQQPMNNIVRVAISALAAVLGGVQTLHTSSYDEALGTPTAESVTIALRTQQILMEECGVTGTVDPLGGSWALESLTADIERAVLDLLAEIDRKGGAIEWIEQGWFTERLAQGAYGDQQAVESGNRKVVGVNVHQLDESAPDPAVFRVDPESERRQLARLARVRARRDDEAVRRALAKLERSAREGRNTIPATIDAVRAYATVGEITGSLRQVYGSYRRPLAAYA